MTSFQENPLEHIRLNIRNFGYHLYSIVSPSMPRYSYTIGLHESSIKSELIFAGAYHYNIQETGEIISHINRELGMFDGRIPREPVIAHKSLGSFKIIPVDPSWGRLLLLGAIDYYSLSDIRSYQIIPNHKHWTKEIPNMSVPYDPEQEPAWQWLTKSWCYSIPETSWASTNFSTLKGEAIVEATRWEEDYWELFSCPCDIISKNNCIIVPLGVLISMDPSLIQVMDLQVEQGIWRDGIHAKWQPWINSNDQ